MAIEASFTIDQADFPLSAVFEQFSDATIELDRVVPTTDAVIPYCWIYADDAGDLIRDLGGDHGIDRVTVIDELEGQTFVRIDWNLAHESVLTAILDTDVTLLSGIGDDEQWTFEVRANNQAELSEFQAYCRERDIPITLTQLHALSSLRSDREYDLTSGQREAMILAYNRGHFDSPQETTQEDLADELGISRQAVASRLQRGTRRLVASTLISPDDQP